MVMPDGFKSPALVSMKIEDTPEGVIFRTWLVALSTTYVLPWGSTAMPLGVCPLAPGSVDIPT